MGVIRSCLKRKLGLRLRAISLKQWRQYCILEKSVATPVSILDNQLKELLPYTISRSNLLDSYSHSPLLFRKRQRHLSDINNQTSGSFLDPRMRNESARSTWKNETDFTSYLPMVYKVGLTVLCVCLCLAYN